MTRYPLACAEGKTEGEHIAHRRQTRPSCGGLQRAPDSDVLLPYCDVPNAVCGPVWRHVGARTCVWNQRGTLPFTLNEAFVRRAIGATPVAHLELRHGAEFLAETGERQRALFGRERMLEESVAAILDGLAAASPVHAGATRA